MPSVTGLTRRDAAKFLKARGFPIAAKTLANMASNNNAGHGPALTRYGWRTVRYDPTDLERWLQSRVERVDD